MTQQLRARTRPMFAIVRTLIALAALAAALVDGHKWLH